MGKKKARIFMQSSILMFFACTTPSIVAHVDDPTRGNVQASFRNLFDSLARKNHRAVNETLNILNQEITQGKQAFDSMNIELQSALGKRSNVKEASLRYRRENLDGNRSPDSSTPDSQTTEILISPTRSPRKFPGEGISWQKLREGGYLYADKSIYLERLLENPDGNIFFYMTRPRRFGKTSFLQMAQNFFDGVESQFNGLQIDLRGNAYFFKKREDGGVPEEQEGKKWIRCPVIYLDFRLIDDFNTIDEFKAAYIRKLRQVARLYKLEYLERESIFDISDLIFELHLKFKLKVVVLVDEYDSPFQNAIVKKKNKVLAEEIRCFLDDLFGAIRGKAEELRLVLVLGVSRLALTTLESGPNNYVDLTYEEEFAAAFGFTDAEIAGFQPEITHQFDLENEKGINEFLRRLRDEYDGYNFIFKRNDGKGKNNVLNPVSSMKCFKNKKFGCYWSETGNVNEVIRRLNFSEEPLEKFEHSKLSKRDIERKRNAALESISMELLLLLYGYFTIENYDEKTEEVTLNFPNNEIRIALKRMVNEYTPDKDAFISEEIGLFHELKWHMDTGRLRGTMNTLTKLFDTQFSCTLQQGANEFSSTMRLVDKLGGAGITCLESVKFLKEKSSPQEEDLPGGDVDVQTVKLKRNFIFSIKYGHSAITAMKQLRDYLKKCRTTFLEAIDEPEEAWFVGINFNSKTCGTLHQWIATPFKKGDLDLNFDECQASRPELCTKLQSQS